MTAPSRRRRAARLVVAGLAAAAALAGCGDGGDTAADTATFCSTLQGELPALNGPALTANDLGEVIAAYERVQPTVPSQVADDWRTLTAMFRDLAAIDLEEGSDAFGAQFAVLLRTANVQAAKNVSLYVKDTCGLDLDRSVEGAAGDGATASTTTTEP